MVRSVLVLTAFVLLVSCEPGAEKSSDPKPSDSGSINTPPITPPTTTKIGTSGLKDTADAIKDSASDAASQVKSASESAAVEIKKTAGSLEEGAAGLAEAAAAIDPSHSVEKLKDAVATLPPESVKGIGDRILAAIQDKDGLVQKLQEQIETLGVADAAKIGELKGSLESAVADVKALKEKLAAVVDKLKATDADVSKYTAAITE
ncbi:MAG TPA: hypothetical protein VMT52_13335 [Planctomycetota bacterium]|nr:hypothetical protein [Planctomycetota bacterium]